MNEWKEVKLGDICTKIGSGATPKGGGNSYQASGISLIRSQNIHDFCFSSAGLAYINEQQAYELRNVDIYENDILINITGESVTRCCIVPNRYLPARVNQHVSIIRPICEKADYRYIFYYLQFIKPELHSIAEIGCTRRALTKGMLEQLDITLPPLPEQKAIAEVLSSLDDKIDLLHRQNKTLESMAETLFRKWFIEDDKEDWKEYRISDIADHIKKSIKPEKSNSYYHYSIPAFDAGKTPTVEDGEQIRSNKYEVISDSILVSKLNPSTPRIWAIGKSIADMSICSTEFQVLKPREQKKYGFLYFLLKSDDAIAELEMAASGTSGSHQRVKPQDIFNIKFSIPNFDLVEEFSEIVSDSLLKIESNQTQIQVLEKLRDTLLPKLISGEVRVKL